MYSKVTVVLSIIGCVWKPCFVKYIKQLPTVQVAYKQLLWNENAY